MEREPNSNKKGIDQQQDEDLDKDSWSRLLLKLPKISPSNGQLSTILIREGSKLIIFCCLKQQPQTWSPKQKKEEDEIQPAVVTVEGLNEISANPRVTIKTQTINEYFRQQIPKIKTRDIGFFHKVSLNEKQNQAVVFPSRGFFDALEMVKIYLETSKVDFYKELEGLTKFGEVFRVQSNIDNQGYSDKGILVELYPRNKDSKYSNKTSIFKFDPKTNSFRIVFVLDTTKFVNSKKITQLYSFGKIDRKPFQNRKRDYLVYIRLFLAPRSNRKRKQSAGNAADLIYVNLRLKKVLFRVGVDLQNRDLPWIWSSAVKFHLVWNDRKRFAMRFGFRTILVGSRQRRKIEYFRHNG